MRTTVDLPDELFRKLKARAALDGLKLKDLLTRYVELGLQADESESRGPARRSEIPLARRRTGRPLPLLSNAELQEVLDRDDLGPS